MTKRVLIVADTHVGHENGINHPDYMSPQDYKDTDGVQLHEKYLEVRDAGGKVDVVIVGGDTCDGANPREQGDQRTATETQQVEIVCKILREIKGSPKFYFVDGSRYHRGIRRLDEQVAKAMGAEKHPHYRCYAPPVDNIQIGDVFVNFAHFITITKSTWQYMTTPIARELVLAELNHNPANIVLRFHAHYYVVAGFHHHLGLVCPAWQTKTPFQGAISPLGEYKIGSIILTVDGSTWDWNDDYIWATKEEIRKA